MNDPATRRFVGGMVLAWAPWIPTLIGLGYAFRGIWNTKATGLAAVAGGIAESLVWWGLMSMIACQVVAVVWLVRSISREHWMRSVVSAASVCASAGILLLVGLVVWLAWVQRRF
jgi:hypothetical protein